MAMVGRRAEPGGAAVRLQCLRCGGAEPLAPGASCCPTCGPSHDPGILDVVYDYDSVKEGLGGRPEFPPGPDIFRFRPLLPVAPPPAGAILAAGGTPLVPAPRLARRLGLDKLYLKDETRNPTRCLKDRATAVGVALALRSGSRDLYCASAGNAAISLAGFCAHAGLACHVFVPAEASAERLAWLRGFGAEVRVSAGGYDDAFAEAEAAARDTGWFSRQCAFNPYLVEGKKTVALEIGEQLGGRAPDIVSAPVGDGCTLGAIGKGFRELRTLGLLDRTPRLLGVQAEAMRPLVRRFRGEPEVEEPGGSAALSIAVRRPRNARRLLAELVASGGEMVAVPDEAIAAAQRALALEAGIVAELTSAAALAGLEALGEERLAGRTAVIVVTGGRAG